MTKGREYYCDIHPLTVLICPRCVAKKGGMATAKRYGTKQLSDWGREGGRPANKKKKLKSKNKKK